jgi:hypothetical protein
MPSQPAARTRAPAVPASPSPTDGTLALARPARGKSSTLTRSSPWRWRSPP